MYSPRISQDLAHSRNSPLVLCAIPSDNLENLFEVPVRFYTLFVLRASGAGGIMRGRRPGQLAGSMAGVDFGGGYVVPSIRTAAPQLLVTHLSDSLAFYKERLGFKTDFVYGDSYASVSRDGALIHLKCDSKSEAERAHRDLHEHLDAYLDVSGIRELHEELASRGAPISKPLDKRPWGRIDFYVRDPDGNVLCFSEVA